MPYSTGSYHTTLSVDVQFFLYLGIVLNVFCVLFMSLLVFLPGTAKYLITKGFALLKKIHLMKEKNNRTERLEQSMKLIREPLALKEKINLRFLTQRLFLYPALLPFAITYVVYRSFGLNTETFFTIIILQAASYPFLLICYHCRVEWESARDFTCVSLPDFPRNGYDNRLLLVSRGFSYYILVIVSGIVSFITHLTVTDKSKKTE